MIYYFLKLPIRLTFMLFFRKVYITNKKKLPKGYSLIFASNHPTAFLDPIFPAAFLRRFTLDFLLRGDVFTSKFVITLLRSVHTIPIFRFRDGFENMRRNQEAFDHCYRALGSGKRHVLVLAEGFVLHAKRLKPIQKGVARLAFGAYEANNKMENIAIIPTAVNYTDGSKFRSDAAMLDFGDPIYLKDYISEYEQNDRKAVKMLTEEIAKRLRKKVVHIEDQELEPTVNRVMDINRNSKLVPSFPILSNDKSALQREMKLADQVNNMDEEEVAQMKEHLATYENMLTEAKVTDLGIAQTKCFNFFNLLFLIIGFLPFLIGQITTYPIIWLGKYAAGKLVKQIEFYSSLMVGVMLVSFTLYWLIWVLVTAIIGNWWWIAFALLLPVIGYFAVFYQERFVLWNEARKAANLKSDIRRKLQQQRDLLLSSVVPGYVF
ncbi:MAG: 1-acyl-sn-glycerol-3-phosphate acyltransferase [Phaeodactylibacter sp.]|nr:1-acyl-sn-glycerol-3-phosphate acyltransferase [Phaeodactylibacter sp.]